ncbi:MAG: hypothetical protein RR447_09775, partial [Algoriella sp.]
ILVVNLRFFFLFILQATNRIPHYAKANMFGRVIFLFLIAIQLGLGFRSYKLMIISDLTGKIISLFYLFWLCKEMVFINITNYYVDLKEIAANINAGSKLFVANVASSLVIGIVRFGIVRAWGVAIFGKVSLTLSISNFVLIFINSVSTIIYPIFRRTSSEKLANIYKPIRDFLTVISFGMLIFYYPFRTIISLWLPKYSESLIYMLLILPMVTYEAKISLLTNTYFKTLRKERLLLKINLMTLFFSGMLTVVATMVIKNLTLAILTILLAQMYRSIISEVYLSQQLKINLKKDNIIEILLVIVFVFSGWYISSWLTTVVYGCGYLLYLLIKKTDLIISFKELKILITN